MNLDKLNQWLSLLANLGVLVGLIFLIAELNQSNRIAVYSAESARRTQFLDMNTSRIENPEIIAKLMKPDPELVLTLLNQYEVTRNPWDAHHLVKINEDQQGFEAQNRPKPLLTPI